MDQLEQGDAFNNSVKMAMQSGYVGMLAMVFIAWDFVLLIQSISTAKFTYKCTFGDELPSCRTVDDTHTTFQVLNAISHSTWLLFVLGDWYCDNRVAHALVQWGDRAIWPAATAFMVVEWDTKLQYGSAVMAVRLSLMAWRLLSRWLNSYSLMRGEPYAKQHAYGNRNDSVQSIRMDWSVRTLQSLSWLVGCFWCFLSLCKGF